MAVCLCDFNMNSEYLMILFITFVHVSQNYQVTSFKFRLWRTDIKYTYIQCEIAERGGIIKASYTRNMVTLK